MASGPVSSYKILCFIPMKNCETTIEATLANFDSAVTRYFTEILVIDNASMDQSVQKAKESLKKIEAPVKKTLLQNSRNYGLGGSHKIAFKYAYDNGFDYILVVHGDASASVKEFETWLSQEKFSKYDMLLSTRFARTAYRENYPFHRLFFNLVLSLLASVITGRRILDFSSGPVNLYRVASFINKFENPLKLFPNDVAFPQYLTLYGTYRKMDLRFHPVDLYEKDRKTLNKMVSQFGKSVILLFRYVVSAHDVLRRDVYGTFYGHTYRKISVEEKPVDLVVPVPAPEKPKNENVVKAAEKIPEPVAAVPVAPGPVRKPPQEIKFIDLRRLINSDSFGGNFDRIEMSSVEACELSDESFIHLSMNLDVETAMSKGLRSFFLRLFKVYSEKKIILDLNVDRVQNSRQCHEFLIFCKEFGLQVHLISHRARDTGIWEIYSKLVPRVTLGFEFGSCTREDFFATAAVIAKNTELHVNILTQPQKFYFCMGLKTQLETIPGINVVVQPYEKNIQPDHEKIILAQKIKSVPRIMNLPVKNRYVFTSKEMDFVAARASGFTKLEPPQEESLRMKVITLDEKGNIFSVVANRPVALGTIYDDPSTYLYKITETA